MLRLVGSSTWRLTGQSGGGLSMKVGRLHHQHHYHHCRVTFECSQPGCCPFSAVCCTTWTDFENHFRYRRDPIRPFSRKNGTHSHIVCGPKQRPGGWPPGLDDSSLQHQGEAEIEHTLEGGTAVAWKRTGHSPAARDKRFWNARKPAGLTVRWPISKTPGRIQRRP